MTNMSSTPMPRSMKGKMLCASDARSPKANARPYPDVTARKTQLKPTMAETDRQEMGLRLPRTKLV